MPGDRPGSTCGPQTSLAFLPTEANAKRWGLRLRTRIGRLGLLSVLLRWTVAVTVIVLIALDLLLQPVATYLAAHAILSGILTSAVFLVIGYWIVDELLRDNERQRWARVKGIGLVALSRGVRIQRRAMAFCVCQQDRFTDADFNPAPTRFDDIEGAVVDVVQGAGSSEDYEFRLKACLQLDAWRTPAYLLLRDASHSLSRLIGRWAAVLAASSNGVGVLTLMSGQAAALDDLLRRLRDEFDGSGVIPEPVASQFCSEWMVQQANAVLIYEWLHTEAKQISFQGTARSTLPPSWRAALPAVPSPSSDVILLSIGDDCAISQVTLET